MLGLSAVTVTSCGDMLDNESEHFIYADKGHLDNATDTLYSVIGILNKMQALSALSGGAARRGGGLL